MKLTGKCRKKFDGEGIFCWDFWEKQDKTFLLDKESTNITTTIIPDSNIRENPLE